VVVRFRPDVGLIGLYIQPYTLAIAVAVLQTIKAARQTLEQCSRHFTLLHLNLERAVIAYYLFIGRISDVENKMCKLYLQIQQVRVAAIQANFPSEIFPEISAVLSRSVA
jgi:hypothetical protein